MADTVDRGAELKRYLDEAFRAFEAGQDERARRLCRQALAIDPDNSTAHSLMGLLYEREGRASEAAGEFEQVVEADPASPAERDTLRRLRGEELPVQAYVAMDAEEEAEAEARRRTLIWAGAAALCVALLVFTGMVAYARTQSRQEATRAAVAQDLQIAQTALYRGQWNEAMQAAQRVMNAKAEPRYAAQAKQIYDQAAARASQSSNVVVAANPNATPYAAPPLPPAEPPVGVVSQPAIQPLPAAPRPATVPIAPAPPVSVHTPQPTVVPPVTVVPPAPVGGGYQVPRVGSQNNYPGLGDAGRAATLGSAMTKAPMIPTRPPVVTNRAPMVGGRPPATTPGPTQPATSGTGLPTSRPAPTGGSGTPAPGRTGTIQIEVHHGDAGNTTSPSDGAEGAGTATITQNQSSEVDPAVQAEAERQRQLRLMRERNR